MDALPIIGIRLNRLMLETMRRLVISILMVLVLGSASGCVYRATVQQGNFIKTEDLDQLATGMTRKQVVFLLGTPMIADPFHQDRWDYVYYLKIGRDDAVYRRWVSVYFEDDIVTEIDKDRQLAHKL